MDGNMCVSSIVRLVIAVIKKGERILAIPRTVDRKP